MRCNSFAPRLAPALAAVVLALAAEGAWGDAVNHVVPPREKAGRAALAPGAAATCPELAIRDEGSIVVVEHDGSDYSMFLPDGSPNYDVRGCVAQSFYRGHSDAYDFIVVFTNFEFETPGARAFYNLVRNDVRGIGRVVADNGWVFGSPSRLKGYIDMAALTRWVPASGVFEPGDPAAGVALHVLAHEVGHQWLAQIRYRDGAGALSSDLLGRDGVHWSYLLDTDASHMYGSDWVAMAADRYRAERVREAYSPLDLYLMGMLPADRTPPFTLLRAPGVDVTALPVEGAEQEATTETVAVPDVVAAEGPRVPDALSSQKEFRLGFVLLVRPGTQPTTSELLAVDRLRELFQPYFFAQTRGVGVADTTLAEAPPDPPLPAVDLDGALAWLLAHQSADGRWEDVPGSGLRDTSLSLEALGQIGHAGDPVERGAGWLASVPAPNTDFVARRILALATRPMDAGVRAGLREMLLRSRNADGGFGPGAGYASTALDTALALRALKALEEAGTDVAGAAVRALAPLESPGGGFGMTSPGAVSTVVTAEVVMALLDWPQVADAAPLLARSLLTLGARRNPDGGFGESPSTGYATALALRALSRAGAPDAQLAPSVAWLRAAQRADRSFGGSRYETALALTALRVALGRNLVVPADSVSFTPLAPREGETVRVTATVRNAGNSAAEPTYVRLYDGAPEAGTLLDEKAVPALAAGEQVSVELEFDTTDHAGVRSMYVFADGRREIEEAREDDNTATFALTVIGRLADLQPEGVLVEPSPAVEGEAALVRLTVRNLGEKRSAPGAVVRLVLGNPRLGGRVLGDIALPPIDAGSAVNLSFTWDTTGALGEALLYAIADPAYVLVESDESNNETATVVEVVTAPPPDPDLGVLSLVAEPSVLSTIPQTVQLHVTVRNRGLTAATTRVAVRDIETGEVLLDVPVEVGARTTVPLVRPLTLTTPGTRQIEAVVDPDDVIPEENESDNRATAVIVDRQDTVDLELGASDVVPSSTDLLVGEVLTVTATVHNRGTAPVVNVPVVLTRSAADGGGELARQVIAALPPGTAATVVLTWKTAATGSPLALLVRVDPFGTFPELSEANNDVALNVTVRPSTQPNLRVTGAGITIAPDPPLEGGSAVVSVHVTNPAVVEAPASTLALYLGDPEDGGTLIGEQPVPPVAAGGEATVEVPWTSVDVGDAAGLFAVADAGDDVDEYDETDNVAFRPVGQVGLPDLAIGMADVTLSPRFPRGGEAAEVRARVHNLGERSAGAAVLRIYEGEAGGVLVAEQPIPPLPVGASAEIPTSWTPGGLGERVLTFIVDADGAVAEGDEGNNETEFHTVVQDADLYLTAPYFSPDGDGTRDETLLAWRASGPVEVVVSDRNGTRVRSLAEEAPAEGTLAWDGRDDAGVLVPDGVYTFTLRTQAGGVLRRVAAHVDTNRLAIHEAAGTGRISVRNLTCTLPDMEGPAWLPSEDGALFLRTTPSPEFPVGLLRVSVEGEYDYVFQDAWYQGALLGPRAVSPDAREVLVQKSSELHVVDLVTGEHRLLDDDSYPWSRVDARWSPDGRFVVVENRLYRRSGEQVALLPGYNDAWSWSPDGKHLAQSFTVVSVDDPENPWTAPIRDELSFSSPRTTEWRADGSVFTWVVDFSKDVVGAQDCDEEGCLRQCRDNGCAFLYRPFTDEVRDLTWLPGRANGWQVVDWSPTADRVLYSRFRTTDFTTITEVAAENGSQALQLIPTGADVSARKSLAYYTSDEAAREGGACYLAGSWDIFAVRSLDNLSVDFQAARLPGNGGLLFPGVASDRNLEGWQLEYATAAAPGTWHAIAPASDAPVLDDVLAAWAPPSPGTFAVRLTARDLAGNVRTRTRVVTWDRYPSIRNITQNEFLISPNADGFKDDVRVAYFVLEPTRVGVRIVGPVVPGATPPTVRRLDFDHALTGAASFVWDGRDEAGQVVADGRYQVLVNEVPLRVDVDNTPPDIAFAFRNLRKDGAPGSAGFVAAERAWHVVDANLKSWQSPVDAGNWPQYEPLRNAGGEIVYDERGRPVMKTVGGRPADLVEDQPDIEALGALSGLGFSAVDRAGNRADVPVAPVPEKLFLLSARETARNLLTIGHPIDPTRVYGLTPSDNQFVLAETISDTPEEKEPLRFQYRPVVGGTWHDVGQHPIDRTTFSNLDFVEMGLDLKEAYQGRFVCDAANGHGDVVSEEFRFRPCERYMVLWKEETAEAVRYRMSTAGADVGVRARMKIKLRGVLLFDGDVEQIGPGEFASPWLLPDCYEVDARVLGTSQRWYPDELEPGADTRCMLFNIGAGPDCSGSGRPELTARQIRKPCAESDPDRVWLSINDREIRHYWVEVEARPSSGPPSVLFSYRVPPRGLLEPLYTVQVDVTGRPHGVLPVAYTIRNNPGDPVLFELASTVFVDRAPPAGEVLQPAEGAVLCVSTDPTLNRAYVPFVVTAVDDAPGIEVFAEFKRDGGAFQPVSRLCPPGGCGDGLITSGEIVEVRWDVTMLPDGDYTARVWFCDRAGNRSFVDRRVTLDRQPPFIRIVNPLRPLFSPNDDGRADVTSFEARLTSAVDLTARVHAGRGTDGPVVATLFTDRPLSSGDHGVVWDGHNAAGAVVPDGIYTIALRAKDPCGREGGVNHTVEVDNTPPVVEIAVPTEDAVVTGSLDVRGTASDKNMARHELAYSVPPGMYTVFNVGQSSVGAPGSPSLLARFVVPTGSGATTLRLFARDRAENEAETTVNVVREPPFRLGPLRAIPPLFSPNGDGRRETTTLEYTLLGSARVSLTVRTPAGAVMRTLVDGAIQEASLYAVPWDGRKDDNTPAPDGEYVVRVTAEVPGGGGLEMAEAGVIVDRRPPDVLVREPAAGSFVPRDTAVSGSIDDLRLDSFVIAATPAGGAPVELASGSENQPSGVLADLSTLADGPHTLAIDAEDQAENRTRVTVDFVIDSIPPSVAIFAPPNGAVLLKGPIPHDVLGAATDENLDDWVMQFGQGPIPAFYNEIRRSPIGGHGIPLGPWSVTTLDDDTYTLRLEARDKAGHTAATTVQVELDGTPPVAALTGPEQCVNAPPAIMGTASDAHLQTWVLESSPGAADSAFQWSPLASGSGDVEGPLAVWNPLPPDGVHTLRLTVTDAVQLSSSTLRTVTVDTTAPAAPTGLRATIRRTGGQTAEVVLNWAAAADPSIVGYRLHRGTGEAIELGVVTTYTDSAVPEGTHPYELFALDGCANTSRAVLTVKVDLTPPQADILRPTEGARVSGSVDIRGTAWSADDFKEYRLFVGAGAEPQDWSLVRRSSLPVLGGVLGTWTALGEGTFTFRLEAEDTNGNQAQAFRRVLVDNDPPEAPVLTSVEHPSPAPADLTALVATWVPVSDPDTIGYLVYRNGRLANATGVVLGDLKPYLVPPPRYRDQPPPDGLPDGEHCYHVIAMDEAGNLSAPSNTLCKTLNNRPPHAVIIQPADGTRFQFPIRVLAFTPDLDVVRVQFQYKAAADDLWLNLGAADTQEPWETTLDPEGLVFGEYHLQAIATDATNLTDPDPTPISVVYGDVTAPAPPLHLQARADERLVSLTWEPSGEPDVAGYHVYRDGGRITDTPLASPSHTDDRNPGTYAYTVTAVDQDGNESQASNEAVAVVYALTLDQPYPVTLETSADVSGGGARPDTTIAIRREPDVVAEVPATADSDRFRAPAVSLVPGLNVFVAQGRDAAGDRSITSNESLLIANTAPAALTGLTAAATGYDVNVQWDASPELDLFGYAVRRGEEPLTPTVPQTTAAPGGIYASSQLHNIYSAARAFDGQRFSYWYPAFYGGEDQWWNIQFPQPVLVERVEIDFVDGNGQLAAPPHYSIEALWEGRFLRLASVRPATTSPAQHTFPWPFATDTLRVVIGSAGQLHGIAEVRVFRQDLVPAGVATFREEGVPDGRHRYEAAAVDRYGAHGPWASVEVPVGDAEPPATPMNLVCVAAGHNALLSWTGNTEVDFHHYAVSRNGAALGTTTTPALEDGPLPNGSYTYAVTAVDAVGNASTPAQASCTIFVAPPVAPVLSAEAIPSGDIQLDWEHPGAAEYVLSRSLVAGGPYTEIARTASREHVDTDTTYGIRHYYVVLALDEAGNPSPLSNEASAIPQRTAPPAAPVILFPTDAAHPTTVDGVETPVRGRSEPGTRVRLTRDGEAVGDVAAQSAFAPQAPRSLPATVTDGLISPDGRYLAHTSVTGLHWIDLASGSEQAYVDSEYLSVWALGFAPDSRRLLYGAWTNTPSERSDVFWVDLRDGSRQPVETGPEYAQGAAWSPDGVTIAVAASDFVNGRILLYDVATGATSTSFEGAGSVNYVAWSPDSARIAFTHWSGFSTDIVVQDLSGGTPLRLGRTSAYEAQWLVDGSGLVFTDTSASSRVFRYDFSSGAATRLTTENRYGSTPGVDPLGRWVSLREEYEDPDTGNWRAEVHALDLTTGERRIVATAPSQQWPRLFGWSRTGYLGTAEPTADGNLALQALPGFDGSFEVASVRLQPGRNTFVARATDIASGLESPDSEPVYVDTPADLFPDLEVTAADLGAYPVVPQVDQNALALARVRNLGPAMSAPVAVRLRLTGPSGAALLDVTSQVAELEPGESATVAAPWRPLAAGDHRLAVVVDEANAVAEQREDNNTAARALAVGNAGLLATVTADRPAYNAHNAAIATATVMNAGGAFSGRARLFVADAQGQERALLAERAVHLAYGAQTRIEATWNTGVSFAGPYSFELRVTDDGGQPAASATGAFVIRPDILLAASLRADLARVPAGSTAGFHGALENRGANAPLSDVVARFVILPEAGGAPLFESAEVPVPLLLPGAVWEREFAWPQAMPPGRYAAELRAGPAGAAPLAVARAPFEVIASTVVVAGVIQAVPAHVVVGTPFDAQFSVTALGAPVPAYPVKVEVVSGPAATVAAVQSTVMDLVAGVGSDGVFTFDTTALSPGPYSLRLRGGEPPVTLARASVRVHGMITPPSIHAPPDGAVVSSARPLLEVNNATNSEGTPLTYQFELYGNPGLGLALPGAAGIPEATPHTSWRVISKLTEDNVYYWRARATDGFAISAWSAIASFRYDTVNRPPSAPVPDTPEPGSVVATRTPVLVVANATDPENDVLTYEFRLAEDAAMAVVLATVAGVAEGEGLTPWSLPLTLDQGVDYWWTARAFDGQNYSPWCAPVSFTVDLANDPPSAPEPLRPAAGERVPTLTPVLVVRNAVDPEGDPLLYRFQLDTVPGFDSPELQISPLLPETTNETEWVAPVPLRDNTRYYWRAAATDGHAFGPWGSSTFLVDLVNEPPGPPVALDPVDGRTVATTTPNLVVRNAVDPEGDVLTYEFEVRNSNGEIVAEATDVGSGALESLWTVSPAFLEDATYSWRARARDAEHAGPWCDPETFRVNAVIAPPSAPTPIAPPLCGTGRVEVRRPALVVANAVSDDGLALTYSFELYAVSGSVLTLVDQVTGVPEGPSQTAWTPGVDLPDGRYSWRARATDTVPQSGPWMTSACFEVAVNVPPAPPVLAASPGDRRVTLSWNASPEPDVTGYRLYRSLVTGGPYVRIAETPAPGHVDTDVVNGTTYYYVVTAHDAQLESVYSNEAAATPQASGVLVAEVRYQPATISGECLIGSCDDDDDHDDDDGQHGDDDDDDGHDDDDDDGGWGHYTGGHGGGGDHDDDDHGDDDDHDDDDGHGGGSDCPQWLKATIELPAGYTPQSISVGSLRLAGTVRADLTYAQVVDDDGDGRPELRVRFRFADVRPRLVSGVNVLTLTGQAGTAGFEGQATVVVEPVHSDMMFTPRTLKRSSTGTWVEVQILFSECIDVRDVDTSSLRLNQIVPISHVVTRNRNKLIVKFNRAATAAVLPNGEHVEVRVTGTLNGRAFLAIDHIRVIP